LEAVRGIGRVQAKIVRNMAKKPRWFHFGRNGTKEASG
jgi:hypothetical protein